MMCHKSDAHEAFPLYGSHIRKTWATSAVVWGGFIQQFLERNLFPFLDQDCSPVHWQKNVKKIFILPVALLAISR